MTLITAERYHDFSYGHRVVGHENKCKYFHGHNGRVHFTCTAPAQDAIGRVIDFSVIKSTLCAWVEDNWDHKFLVWAHDPVRNLMSSIEVYQNETLGVTVVPFNPTAENMASHLLTIIGPIALAGTGVTLTSVRLEETRKCGATASL